MTKVAVVLFLTALLGCGKSDPPRDPIETEQYRSWRGGQVLRRLPAANFAPTTPGRVEIFSPEARSKTPGDFCELYVNGERVPSANLKDGDLLAIGPFQFRLHLPPANFAMLGVEDSTEFSPSMGIHTGPGVVGVAWLGPRDRSSDPG